MHFERDRLLPSRTRNLSLLLSLFSGLLGSSLFYAGVYYFTTQRTSTLKDLDWPVNTKGFQLDIRDGLDSRDLLSALGDLFRGALPSTDAGALGGILTTIENSITKLLGDPGGSLLDGLAEPSKFLGVGLASGALTGLNMTTANIPTATGVSNLAENLGSGLTSTIFSSDSIKSLFTTANSGPGGTLGGSDGTVGQAVLALGQGKNIYEVEVEISSIQNFQHDVIILPIYSFSTYL